MTWNAKISELKDLSKQFRWCAETGMGQGIPYRLFLQSFHQQQRRESGVPFPQPFFFRLYSRATRVGFEKTCRNYEIPACDRLQCFCIWIRMCSEPDGAQNSAVVVIPGRKRAFCAGEPKV